MGMFGLSWNSRDVRDLAGHTLAADYVGANFPLVNPAPPVVSSIVHYADSGNDNAHYRQRRGVGRGDLLADSIHQQRVDISLTLW